MSLNSGLPPRTGSATKAPPARSASGSDVSSRQASSRGSRPATNHSGRPQSTASSRAASAKEARRTVRFSQSPADAGVAGSKGAAAEEGDATDALNATAWVPPVDVEEAVEDEEAADDHATEEEEEDTMDADSAPREPRPSAPKVEAAQWEGGSLLDVNADPADMPATLLPTPDATARKIVLEEEPQVEAAAEAVVTKEEAEEEVDVHHGSDGSLRSPSPIPEPASEEDRLIQAR